AHTVLQTFKSGEPGGLFTLDGPTGRFRPLYWLWLVGQYWLWGPRPLAFFLVLWLALIATSLLVREILRIATHDARAGLLGGQALGRPGDLGRWILRALRLRARHDGQESPPPPGVLRARFPPAPHPGRRGRRDARDGR